MQESENAGAMPEDTTTENKIYLNAEEFMDVPDGEEVEVSVRGMKQTLDGRPYLHVTEVDGVPVEGSQEMDPKTEATNRMKEAGYLKGTQEFE